jgi:hypothetical protein
VGSRPLCTRYLFYLTSLTPFPSLNAFGVAFIPCQKVYCHTLPGQVLIAVEPDKVLICRRFTMLSSQLRAFWAEECCRSDSKNCSISERNSHLAGKFMIWHAVFSSSKLICTWTRNLAVFDCVEWSTRSPAESLWNNSCGYSVYHRSVLFFGLFVLSLLLLFVFFWLKH